MNLLAVLGSARRIIPQSGTDPSRLAPVSGLLNPYNHHIKVVISHPAFVIGHEVLMSLKNGRVAVRANVNFRPIELQEMVRAAYNTLDVACFVFHHSAGVGVCEILSFALIHDSLVWL